MTNLNDVLEAFDGELTYEPREEWKEVEGHWCEPWGQDARRRNATAHWPPHKILKASKTHLLIARHDAILKVPRNSVRLLEDYDVPLNYENHIIEPHYIPYKGWVHPPELQYTMEEMLRDLPNLSQKWAYYRKGAKKK